MKLALLGDDPALLTLARAAVAQRHQIAWLGEAGSLQADADRLTKSIRPSGAWESLLDQGFVDAVLVSAGQDEELRADQLRKLVQAAIPLLLVHPISGSMLFCYELDMIRREYSGIVQFYSPGRGHPAIDHAAQWVRQAEPDGLGAIEQVVFARDMANRSKPAVLRQLAQDVALIAEICGEQDQVTALGGADESVTYQNLSLQCSGPSQVMTRWTVGPVESGAAGCARVSLIGERGRADIAFQDDQHPWVLETVIGAKRESVSLPPWDGPAQAIERLDAAIAADDRSSDWFVAAQAVEVVDAAQRSLAKGRTIQLHFEEYSDEATFKGRMATYGCGLILLGLAVMCLAGFIGDVLGIPLRWLPADLGAIGQIWPLAILAALVLFLLIQALPLFSREDRREE